MIFDVVQQWGEDAEWRQLPDRLYVVGISTRGEADPDAPIWTLSPRPDATGWETDLGHPGYGIPRAAAEAIAEAYNAARERGRAS